MRNLVIRPYHRRKGSAGGTGLTLSFLSVKGYRSIRSIRFPIDPLSTFVGANGVGKSNLYRSLFLLQCAAKGTITRHIVAEGGIGSVLWAGPRKQNKRVRLSLTAEMGPLSYRIEIGLPSPTQAALNLEPMIKEEELLCHGKSGRPACLMKRDQSAVWLTDEEGRRAAYDGDLLPSETALATIQDATQYPELWHLRQDMLNWRFYDGFRTDKDSPIRRPCMAVATPTLSSDGTDLAAVIETLARIRQDTSEVDEAIANAFPGAELHSVTENGRCRLALDFPDMPRPLEMHELSDGTLQFLCLAAALLGYRRPTFIALNEPEKSLHADLLEPLARLITDAAEHTNIWVVTHSTDLSTKIQTLANAAPRRVIKENGATWIEGLSLTGSFRPQSMEL